MDQHRRARIASPLVAAATMVARHAEYSIRIVLPYGNDQIDEVEQAAEMAGVDVVVARSEVQATVAFVARHQDRRVTPKQLRATLRSVKIRSPQPAPKSNAPRLVDVGAFHRASEALALDQGQDPEVELIWDCLLRARVRAHLCGGIPTLVVNDVGGLVGILRRRARMLGVALRINPDACACG